MLVEMGGELSRYLDSGILPSFSNVIKVFIPRFFDPGQDTNGEISDTIFCQLGHLAIIHSFLDHFLHAEIKDSDRLILRFIF